MNGHDPARRQQGMSALLPNYCAARLSLAAVLIGFLALLWGLESQIIATLGGEDEFFLEDFQAFRNVMSALAGTILIIVLLGEELLIATLLAGMTIVTFAQVVLRYGFNSGILWGLEASIYMFAWMVLLGMSYGVKVSSHIGIDLAVKLLPRGSQRFIGVIAVCLSLVYAALMLWGSYTSCYFLGDLWRDLLGTRGCGYIDTLIRLDTFAEDIPAPRWLLAIILPVGFALLAFRLLQVLLGILSGRRFGFELGDEVKDALQGHRPAADDHLSGR